MSAKAPKKKTATYQSRALGCNLMMDPLLHATSLGWRESHDAGWKRQIDLLLDGGVVR
jgi:hypothetical protein